MILIHNMNFFETRLKEETTMLQLKIISCGRMLLIPIL